MEREQLLSMQGCDSLKRVEILRRQYLQMLEPDKLTLPSSEELILPQTQAYIFATMFNSESLSFVPSVRYQFRVLKKIIAALEKSVVYPEEDVCLPLPCSLLGEKATSNAFFGCIFSSIIFVNMPCDERLGDIRQLDHLPCTSFGQPYSIG